MGNRQPTQKCQDHHDACLKMRFLLVSLVHTVHNIVLNTGYVVTWEDTQLYQSLQSLYVQYVQYVILSKSEKFA